MAQPHYSKATIMGHPIHPMIVGFPIAFYTTGVVTLIAYATTRNPFWFQASMYLWFAGVGTAMLAALFGVVDLFAGVPRRSKARRTGIKHMALNVLGLAAFAAAAAMLATTWYQNPLGRPLDQLDFGMPLLFGVLGLALTVGAGALGGKLIYTHRIGMDEAPAPDEVAAREGIVVTEPAARELGATGYAAPRASEPVRPIEEGLGP